MNRIIREKNANYTTISNVFLKDKNLSLKAKGLLAIVMSLPENWDFTISGIVKIIQEGKGSTSSAIKELIERGYCKRILCKEANGKFTGYDYTFYEESQIPVAEKPSTGNPNTEEPFTANPPQLNTNLINDLNNKDSEKDENKFSLSVSDEFKKYLIELENFPLCKKIEIQLTDKNLTDILKEFEFEQIIEGLEIIENSRTVKSRKNLYLTLKKILKNNFGGGKEFQSDLRNFKQVYIDFMVKRNKVEPKLSKTSNSVFIELFEYFKKISNTKDTEGAIKSFKFIFENWNKLDSFLSQKVEIENINRNINEITTKIKNEYGSKTATNNGDYNRLSIQEIARIASQRKDHINPF